MGTCEGEGSLIMVGRWFTRVGSKLGLLVGDIARPSGLGEPQRQRTGACRGLVRLPSPVLVSELRPSRVRGQSADLGSAVRRPVEIPGCRVRPGGRRRGLRELGDRRLPAGAWSGLGATHRRGGLDREHAADRGRGCASGGPRSGSRFEGPSPGLKTKVTPSAGRDRAGGRRRSTRRAPRRARGARLASEGRRASREWACPP